MRILWGIVAFLLVFWIIGVTFRMLGQLIHLALLVAALLFVVGILSGRNKV
jgi:hypothetical protein